MINDSTRTVKRRQKELGLMGSATTSKALLVSEVEDLVLREMEKDPAKRYGVQTVQKKIAFNKQVHVPW